MLSSWVLHAVNDWPCPLTLLSSFPFCASFPPAHHAPGNSICWIDAVLYSAALPSHLDVLLLRRLLLLLALTIAVPAVQHAISGICPRSYLLPHLPGEFEIRTLVGGLAPISSLCQHGYPFLLSTAQWKELHTDTQCSLHSWLSMGSHTIILLACTVLYSQMSHLAG